MAPLPAPTPLAQVRVVLHHAAPPQAALPHVAHLVSRFLDVSPFVPITRAAASGSLRLFRRVASRLFDASVDHIDREYALAKALEAAIRADDLAMVQAVHELHPEPLYTRSLTLAMAHGSFELVQWVIRERHDRVCCASGVENLCRGCAELAGESIGDKDAFRIASWLIEEGAIAVTDGSVGRQTWIDGDAARTALLKSAELVRWCDARGLLTEDMLDSLLRETLNTATAATAEIVRYILERGFAPTSDNDLDDFVDRIVWASCYPNQEALVEYVLASDVFASVRAHFVYAPIDAKGGRKVLQWDRAYEEKRKAAMANGFDFKWMVSQIAGTMGQLDVMKWLADKCGVTTLEAPRSGVTEDVSLNILQWIHDTGNGRLTFGTMNCAAANGHLRVIQWLHENRSEGCSARAMDNAAAKGHLEVVQWLHANRSEGCTRKAMNRAAGQGHLDVVKWLHENRSEGVVSEAMAHAAAKGELDVVRWCFEHGGCARCVQRALLAQSMSYNPIWGADFDPRPLYALRWLELQSHSECAGQCVVISESRSSMNLAVVALGSGDLLLAEYLHQHHSDLFAWRGDQAEYTMNGIASQGHLPVFQWLHARYPNSLDWHSGVAVAEQKHRPEIAEWLRGVVAPSDSYAASR